MTSRLETLPAELLSSILLLVSEDPWERPDKPCDRPVLGYLSDISTVSKTIQLANEEFLFREYGSDAAFSGRSRLFLRSLCEKPRLQHLVQDLFITPDSRHPGLPNDSELHLFRTALEPFNDREWHDVILQALAKGCHTAEIVMVLALTTKVKKIRAIRDDVKYGERCSHCPSMESLILAVMSHDAGLRNSRYDKLQHIRYSADKQNVTMDVARLFLRLPRLQSLSLTGLSFGESQSTIRRSTIKTLILTSCQIGVTEVAVLLQSCEAIEFVDISWMDDVPMSIEKLCTGLACHERSLTRLSLHRGIEPKFYGEQPGVEQFERFVKLSHLDVDEHYLTGGSAWNHDGFVMPILPPHLRSLEICTDARLVDLPHILLRLRLQSQGLIWLQVSFPLLTEDNARFVEYIEEMPLNWDLRLFTANNWIVYVARAIPGFCIKFACWATPDQTIDVALEGFAGDLAHWNGNLAMALLHYYLDWPTDVSDPDLVAWMRDRTRRDMAELNPA